MNPKSPETRRRHSIRRTTARLIRLDMNPLSDPVRTGPAYTFATLNS
jgi:hypothetical protein